MYLFCNLFHYKCSILDALSPHMCSSLTGEHRDGSDGSGRAAVVPEHQTDGVTQAVVRGVELERMRQRLTLAGSREQQRVCVRLSRNTHRIHGCIGSHVLSVQRQQHPALILQSHLERSRTLRGRGTFINNQCKPHHHDRINNEREDR